MGDISVTSEVAGAVPEAHDESGEGSSNVFGSELQKSVTDGAKDNGSDGPSVTPAVINGVVVKGGWDELPHNMGSLASNQADVNPAVDAATTTSAKPTKKRAPAKPRAKKNLPTKTKEKSDIGQDENAEAANDGDGGAADVPAKSAPKKRAPRKKAPPKPAPAQGDDDGAEGADEEAASVDKSAPKRRMAPKRKAAASVKTGEHVTSEQDDAPDESAAAAKVTPITPAKTPRKRAPPKSKVAKDEVKNEDEATPDANEIAPLAPVKTPKPRASRKKVIQQPSPATSPDGAAAEEETPKAAGARKRAKKEEEESDFEKPKPKRKRASRAKKLDTSEDVQHQVDKLIDSVDSGGKTKKPKANKYGITPGASPFPDWPLPTREACYEVNRLLSAEHGEVQQPATIPPPSLEVTGCGEVPSVLDALIRTRLSAATTSTNSGYAFAGLVEKFGICEDGIGKGSVDWNKVRQADAKDIEQAIKRGGLAKTKSESIKAILEQVHEQNIARREAFKKEKEEGIKADVIGADSLTQGAKDLEIAAADQDVLSLQFMHFLTAEQAMEELTKFNGIGVKTASCVILFCLRHPSFAVDTHVYRLCKWLKWIPEGATRDKTFSHCEVRIPHELKYSLHQLFIRHGKTCGRCRAATGSTSEAWMSANCPIEHLVERTGERKTFKPSAALLKKRGKKGKKAKKGEEDDSDSELSEHDDEEFEDLLSEEHPQLPEQDAEENASEADTEILDEVMGDAPEDQTKEEK